MELKDKGGGEDHYAKVARAEGGTDEWSRRRLGQGDKPKRPVEDRFFRVVQGMEKRLETRLKALEDKFFAFQCGAQAQMERDRQAMVFERLAGERPPVLDESADSSP